jgi:hypothetical protein
MRQNQYFNVRCARCSVLHDRTIRAWTYSGAITKATVQCDGIEQTEKGPKATLCATPETRERLEGWARN